MKKVFDLKNWHFKIDSLGFEKDVTLPHTWNTDENEKVQLYRGKAEYRTEINLDGIEGRRAILYLGCAYHTCRIYVNGRLGGKHSGCGYLPFETDIGGLLKEGRNEIRITADNSKSKNMLPYLMNFDWADDGGLTRNAVLTVYEKGDILGVEPTINITKLGGGVCSGKISLAISSEPQEMRIDIIDCSSGETALSQGAFVDGSVAVPFEGLKLWSVDSPELYYIKVTAANDSYTLRTGFRTVEIKDAKVLLNGKEIYLKGCEWMPGSHPDYGMAEPLEHSEMRLSQLKNAGCVFTRFHWQQDTSLFDRCDEYGLLVQEEIPYWGAPKKATKRQLAIAEQQARDMVHYHGHHPSIICWGVGNELDGRSKRTIGYVDDMYSFFKSLDGSRLVNYVSNSLHYKFNRLKDEATLHGDIAMWNDYLGLWLPCEEGDIERVIRETYDRCGDMPSLVSEFGLCEPFFKGGDKRRTEILKQRVPIYKTLPRMVGYMWFSLNDYRTHCGEEGKGRMKQRIHGSTDLYGSEKPSYRVLKEI